MKFARLALITCFAGLLQHGTMGFALAQVPSKQVLAEALFREGRELLAEGRATEACPKFQESYELDPALGTLLNLAACHEREGKTATAWAEFSDAAQTAQRAGDARHEFASSRVVALSKKLSRLTIQLEDGEGVEVTVNGQRLGSGAWGSAIPLDPGSYTVRATKPGAEPWSETVVIPPGPSEQTLEVPGLEPASSAAPGSSSEGRAPAGTSSTNDHSVEGDSSSGLLRPSVLTAGTIGLVGLGAGTYFGLRTFSKKRVVDDHCSEAAGCDAVGEQANRAAHQAAWMSNIGFGVGLLGVTTAVYLLLTGERENASSTAVRVAPVVGETSGIQAVGRF